MDTGPTSGRIMRATGRDSAGYRFYVLLQRRGEKFTESITRTRCIPDSDDDADPDPDIWRLTKVGF